MHMPMTIVKWSCFCFAVMVTSACSHRLADQAGSNVRASGSNPDWTLTISDSRMVFDRADGRDVSVATPREQSGRAGQTYETPEMKVFVATVEKCENAESYRVDVTVEGTTYRGCTVASAPD